MDFSYTGYARLLSLLRQHDYETVDYHNYEGYSRCVILHHDIDTDLTQAVRLAELEAEAGVRSTYFVLLRTDFYNPASSESLEQLHRIQALGHEIGLHFDEKAYPTGTQEEMVQRILKERGVLSALLETEVSTVSMHRLPGPR